MYSCMHTHAIKERVCMKSLNIFEIATVCIHVFLLYFLHIVSGHLNRLTIDVNVDPHKEIACGIH